MSTPTQRLRTTLAAAGVVGVIGLFAGCGASTPPASADPDACDAPASITIASFPVGTTLPTDVAEGIGAFDEVEEACNTEITITSFDSPQPMVAGVLSGQVHFAVSNVQNQLLAAAQGQDLTGLLSMAQGGNGIVVGNPDASTGDATGVDALRDYPADSIWAVTTVKGLSALVVSAVNEAIGNDPAKIQFVQTGGSAIPSTVASGSADLGYVPSPTAAQQAVDSGEVRPIFNASGSSVYDLIGFIPGWTMLASPDFVAKYPQLATRMAAAELKGLRFIQDNVDDPQAVFDVMPTSFTSATSAEVWERSWGWNASNYLVTGWITRDDVLRTGELMQRYDVLTSDYDLSKLPDTVLAPDILKDAFALIGEDVPETAVNEELLRQTSD
jgi:ABC-type nitrate/sulfonate/bicarbonate transport system substrate-binding protein